METLLRVTQRHSWCCSLHWKASTARIRLVVSQTPVTVLWSCSCVSMTVFCGINVILFKISLKCNCHVLPFLVKWCEAHQLSFSSHENLLCGGRKYERMVIIVLIFLNFLGVFMTIFLLRYLRLAQSFTAMDWK